MTARRLLFAAALAACLAACGPPARRGAAGGSRGGEGEGEGSAEGEGEGAAEGEGEGEGEGPAEGEGEGAAEGEGEGPSEGEGEGAAEGEGEGEGPPDCVPRDERCNGADDDCDGRTDEDDPELGDGCSTNLPGPCWQGRLRCQQGRMVCVGVVQPAEEVCDGLDNDCDGEADEDDPGTGQDCEADQARGICREGTTRCGDGVLRCDPSSPREEACNGLDDNCDGEVDEDAPGDGEPCDTGELGVCAAGLGDCTVGVFTCVRHDAPSVEACNGLDDDCDGAVDEGSPGDGEPCDTGQEGVCAGGVGACQAGVFSCARLVEPGAERCDLLDNDCDGQADEGPPEHGLVCQLDVPVGACLFGVSRCEDGVVHCDAFEPAAEECDGRDNDCDGEVDEDDGQGECTRPNVMRCGNSSRDVASFFPAGAALRLVVGCNPDDDTQALVLSRSAVVPAAAVLQPYVENGGIVITEYNISHTVFSRLFVPAVQGQRMGSCQDNIATVVQYTPGDRFWQDNPFQAIPAAQTGCGYDVSRFPGIVPLAGWDAQTACLGYRRLGRGRFWALDVDWQDREVAQSQYTRDLIGYMIMTR